MLRITIDKSQNGASLRVEGKLTGPWVNELERAWQDVKPDSTDSRVSVDLTDITLVSEEGKRLLEQMYGQGAKFKTSRCTTRNLVEEIGHSFKK